MTYTQATGNTSWEMLGANALEGELKRAEESVTSPAATLAGERRKLDGGAAKALAFLLAGKATVTFVSLRTGVRYTYKVSVAKDNDQLFFVSLLTGSNNEQDFSYLGIIRTEGGKVRFQTTRK